MLVGVTLASCNNRKKEEEQRQVYMRADRTAPYTNTTGNYNNNGASNMLMTYMMFSAMRGNHGYASSGLHYNSNVGSNTSKVSSYNSSSVGRATPNPAVSRSGFGSSSKSTVSS